MPAVPPTTQRNTYVLIMLALVAGLVVGAASVHLWVASQAMRANDATQESLAVLLTETRAELFQTHARIDALQGQLTVEESTRKGLEASLQQAQAELGLARDQVAFFDQLLPPGPAGSVSIRALDIEQRGPNLHYRVLLMRNSAEELPFKGLMQFVAKGSRQGKAVKIVLQAPQLPGNLVTANVDPLTSGFELNFDQFQRSGGLLSIPDGFLPQTITLNVLEGTRVRVSRTVNVSAAE
ncbi:hypothetical protein EKL30_16905 [Candidimonas sp. SYP-B2681]|uniref:DUF6776 family protein n=1 Tax=Candidimonas sp. SYP-B2681 TaxID=2497686 RepID=UPI000F88209C|nr:DUF6776 family protein [Candidimonas sp. SYP-B2681]RTZ39939.1 hypothetical protein EKL30_16905 [Candidimonas sp. SYP-B2681]